MSLSKSSCDLFSARGDMYGGNNASLGLESNQRRDGKVGVVLHRNLKIGGKFGGGLRHWGCL